MATHKLFQGGLRGRTGFPTTLFPSTDVEPDQYFQPDHRQGDIVTSQNRRFVFKDSDVRVGFSTDFSDGLSEYVDCLEAPFAAGDIIEAVILPRHTSVDRIWVNVELPAAGLLFDITLRGNSASSGGPAVLAAGIDGSVVGSQLIVLPDHIYFDQNDMLQLVLTTVDHAALLCGNFTVSPVITEYCRGVN
jgi:hypothetical protein